MKKAKKTLKTKAEGITLIALVVTIIVLLILAGVSISMLTGENGILKRAREAAEKTEQADREERAQLDQLTELIDETASGEKTVEQVTDKNPGKLEEENGAKVINSIEDLVYFADSVTKGTTYLGETVKLGLSLDFNSSKSYVDPYRKDYGAYGYNGELKTLLTSEEGFSGIGDETNFFSGTFDGNDCSIKNITISNSGIAGLFVCVKGATIKNLTISGNICSTNFRVGGIVGQVENNETTETNISNCTNNATISSQDTNHDNQAGGIIGNTNGILNISNCSNKGNITSYNHTGGIIARIDGDTEITNCDNSGSITVKAKTASIGGIAGSIRPNKHCEVKKCFNTSTIEVKGNGGDIYEGGIIGSGVKDSDLDIIECYNMGEIKGDSLNNVGGIIGTSEHNIVKIDKCYNKGNVVSKGISAGGVIGLVTMEGKAEISCCYNEALIKMSNENFVAGGIVGYIYKGGSAQIKNCYNVGTIEAVSNMEGGICGKVRTVGASEELSTENSNLTIINCYNRGTAESAIIYEVFEDATATVTNTYYLNGSGKGIIGQNVTGTAVVMDEDDMITEDFVSKLNQSQEGNVGVWKQDIDGSKNNYYPILN